MPRAPTHPRQVEPETQAHVALVAWFAVDPDTRTQAKFAEACGVAQQTINSIVLRRTRPAKPLAEVIAAVTQGEVIAEGWFTPEERRARAEALVAAARAGAAMSVEAPVSPT